MSLSAMEVESDYLDDDVLNCNLDAISFVDDDDVFSGDKNSEWSIKEEVAQLSKCDKEAVDESPKRYRSSSSSCIMARDVEPSRRRGSSNGEIRKRKVSREIFKEKKTFPKNKKSVDKIKQLVPSGQKLANKTYIKNSALSDLRLKIENSISKSHLSVTKFKKFSDFIESKYDKENIFVEDNSGGTCDRSVEHKFFPTPELCRQSSVHTPLRKSQDSKLEKLSRLEPKQNYFFSSEYSFTRVNNCGLSFDRSKSIDDLSLRSSDISEQKSPSFCTFSERREFFERMGAGRKSFFQKSRSRYSHDGNFGGFSSVLSKQKSMSVDDLSIMKKDSPGFNHYVNLISAKPFNARKSIDRVRFPVIEEQEPDDASTASRNILERSFTDYTLDI